MIKKTGNFFEENIEKIVLILVGLLSIWLFFSRVAISPNRIEYESGRMLSPGKVDLEVVKEVDVLQQLLESTPKENEPYKSKKNEILSLMDSAINEIDANLYLLQPPPIPLTQAIKSKYYLPKIGELGEAELFYVAHPVS